uniref:Uncharacterized protein n=1 Tax=uncultured Armatimonadetes bacterium TaxID=157466 RepID=A0A6J4HFE2_9BACT|nr:hypothetical protein AVDCRST_MAG63-420 [uncultured Armatimonadetes bacterium]
MLYPERPARAVAGASAAGANYAAIRSAGAAGASSPTLQCASTGSVHALPPSVPAGPRALLGARRRERLRRSFLRFRRPFLPFPPSFPRYL